MFDIRTALKLSLPALVAISSYALSGQPTSNAKVPANDSIQTPVDDLNLRKSEIPAALQNAVDKPYSLDGLGNCSQIIAAVEALDTALGKDIDQPQQGGNRLAASDIANFAASSFIPFRGVIREVTGASSRQRQLQEAVLAGFARRSFLKGVGQSRNCAYPARPASAQLVAAQSAALVAELKALCGPLPGGRKRSRAEEWRNSRKCTEYNRARQQQASPGSR